MIFMWDIKNIQKISVYRTFLYHAGPINDIQYIPNSEKLGMKDQDPASEEFNLDNENGLTKFVTCSSDRTIRFWHYIDSSLPKLK
jgi:WD40 repeat protein